MVPYLLFIAMLKSTLPENKALVSQNAHFFHLAAPLVLKISAKHLTLSQSNKVWNIVARNRWDEYFARELVEENIKSKGTRLVTDI